MRFGARGRKEKFRVQGFEGPKVQVNTIFRKTVQEPLLTACRQKVYGVVP
jgi:hypothetical protein